MELMEELVEEVLIRVPPDEPAHGAASSPTTASSAATACSRTPPLLGYLHNLYSRGPIPRFVPTTTTSPFAAAAPPPPLGGCERWRALDCRHGRVLARAFFDHDDDPLIVWDPTTGDQRRLAVPPPTTTDPRGAARRYTGAVLCAAADGCDHLGCHGGPFLVAYMVADEHHAVRVSVYSSETDAWGPPSAAVHVGRLFDARSSLLAGGALHFALYGGEGILRYDLRGHRLSVMETPGDFTGMVLVKADGGRLGFATTSSNGGFLYLWTQQQQAWAQHEAIDLKAVLPRGRGYRCHTRQVIGFAEASDTIFINRAAGVFALDLKSRRARMVGAVEAYDAIISPVP
nr:unnamed protein product [Digitaria exilis]